MITTVAVLVGGKGTRLAGFLGDTPKPLALIAGTPLIEMLIARLSAAGALKIYLLTGHKAEAFESYNNFKYGSTVVQCIRENEPLGSAGALLNAEHELFNDTFILLNGDTFLDVNYTDLLSLKLPEAFEVGIGLCEVADASRYGSVKILKDGPVSEFVEKGISGPGLVNAGVFVINKLLLNSIKDVSLKKAKNFLTLENDLFPILLQKRKLYSFPISGGFVDIGVPESYCTFNVDSVLNKALNESHGFLLRQVLVALFEEKKIVCVVDKKPLLTLFSFLNMHASLTLIENGEDGILKTLEDGDLVLNIKVSESSRFLNTRAQVFNFSENPISPEMGLDILFDNSWANKLVYYWELVKNCRGYVKINKIQTKKKSRLD